MCLIIFYLIWTRHKFNLDRVSTEGDINSLHNLFSVKIVWCYIQTSKIETMNLN